MRLLRTDYSPAPVWVWTPSRLLRAMVTGLYVRLFPHWRGQNVRCGTGHGNSAGSWALSGFVFSFWGLSVLCAFYQHLWASLSVGDEQEVTSWKQFGGDPRLFQNNPPKLGEGAVCSPWGCLADPLERMNLNLSTPKPWLEMPVREIRASDVPLVRKRVFVLLLRLGSTQKGQWGLPLPTHPSYQSQLQPKWRNEWDHRRQPLQESNLGWHNIIHSFIVFFFYSSCF